MANSPILQADRRGEEGCNQPSPIVPSSCSECSEMTGRRIELRSLWKLGRHGWMLSVSTTKRTKRSIGSQGKLETGVDSGWQPCRAGHKQLCSFFSNTTTVITQVIEDDLFWQRLFDTLSLQLSYDMAGRPQRRARRSGAILACEQRTLCRISRCHDGWEASPTPRIARGS